MPITVALDPQNDFHRGWDEKLFHPVKGKVRCVVCRAIFPFDRAYWYEKVQAGVILVRMPGHGECFAGKTPEQIELCAHQLVAHVVLPQAEAHDMIQNWMPDEAHA